MFLNTYFDSISFCKGTSYPYRGLSLFFFLCIIFSLNSLNFFVFSFCVNWSSLTFPSCHQFRLLLFPPLPGYLSHSIPFKSTELLSIHFSVDQDYGCRCQGGNSWSGLSVVFSWVLLCRLRFCGTSEEWDERFLSTQPIICCTSVSPTQRNALVNDKPRLLFLSL